MDLSRFKKCQLEHCDYTASKLIAVEIPGREEQLGNWREEKMTGGGQLHRVKTIKLLKMKVCSVCYNSVTPDFFFYKDKVGVEHEAKNIRYLSGEPKKNA